MEVRTEVGDLKGEGGAPSRVDFCRECVAENLLVSLRVEVDSEFILP